MQAVLTIRTSGPGLHEFTAEVVRFVREAGVEQGLLTLFVQHTSCSLCIQENADPDVRRDLDEFFRRLVPSSDDPSMQWLTHTTEGADDMPAHIKAALTAVSLRLLRVAERTGQMGEMLERTAGFHDEDVSQAIEWFIRLFEPLLMIGIGIVIGIVVLLMYAPIFELAGSLQ